MKKVICILFTLTVLFVSAFADKSRFYENGKVIDTMYVDSEDGLKVRDYPSLKSNRLCGLQHRLPVKVVAIGREETIDGITAPWVEILIPRYEWKAEEPEFGWVFGGYLAKEMPKTFAVPKTKDQLKFYIETHTAFRGTYKTGVDYYISFFVSNKSVGIGIVDKYGKDSDSGKITYVSANKFEFAAKHNDYTKGTIVLSNIMDNGFTGEISGYKGLNNGRPMSLTFTLEDTNTYCGFNSVALYFRDYYNQTNELYSNPYFSTQRFDFPHTKKELDEEEFVAELIKAGVSAKGTIYEQQYHDYWNPIMEQHQKKADKMK